MEEPSQQNFTLVELLVVIAIIAVLASMLLPALQSARAKSVEASCLNQQKQMGIAMKSYEDDHRVTFGWQIGVDPMDPCLYGHTTHGSGATRNSHARTPGSGLWYSHNGNIRWYGPAYLIRWGYVPGYEEVTTTGSHENKLFWCPSGNSPGYRAGLETVTYAWNNNQNQWSPNAWKAWFWNLSYSGAGRGAQTNYLFDYVVPSDIETMGAAAVPAMWDMDFTSELSGHYASVGAGEILAKWNSLHPSGYNVLYYDGHAKLFNDASHTIALGNRGQGLNGHNDTAGLTGFGMREQFIQNH